MQNKNDIAVATAKLAPPMAVTTLQTIMGLSLGDWVSILTICYVVLQIAHLIWRWRRQSADRGSTDTIELP